MIKKIVESCVERYFDMELLARFPERVTKAIEAGKRILILTHPRNWEVDTMFNTKENIKRALEGFVYRM